MIMERTIIEDIEPQETGLQIAIDTSTLCKINMKLIKTLELIYD